MTILVLRKYLIWQHAVMRSVGPEPCCSQLAWAGMRFRCGRSDAVDLSEEAVKDIYETVQRWHSEEHREMMRAHFQGTSVASKNGIKSHLPRAGSGVFSVTPTLDAHEATVFALNESETKPESEKTTPQGEERGAASRHIEEAQLRLAVELSKKEAEQKPEMEKNQQRDGDAKPMPAKPSGPHDADAATTPEGKAKDR